MRILLYSSLVAALALMVNAPLSARSEAENGPAEPRKDAAEAVGEGNAARWLDYYRRERGANWQEPPKNAQSSSPPEEKSKQPAKTDP